MRTKELKAVCRLASCERSVEAERARMVMAEAGVDISLFSAHSILKEEHPLLQQPSKAFL